MKKLEAYFDGELSEKEQSEMQELISSDASLRQELEDMQKVNESVRGWFAAKFVDDELKPLNVSVWEEIEHRLPFQVRQKGVEERISNALDWIDERLAFYPKQFALIGVMAMAMAAAMIWHSDNGRVARIDADELETRVGSQHATEAFFGFRTARLDVDWVRSDRSVSVLNAGSKKGLPVIWVANKTYK